MHNKEIIEIYQSFKRVRETSHRAAFNIDYFAYLKSSDSLSFAKPVLGSNCPDCSKRSIEIENQKINLKKDSFIFPY